MLRESDKRVVKAFVAERPADSNLLETDGVKLDKIGLGGETVAKWIDGRIAIVSTESAKSDESIIRLISKEAGPGVVDFSYARKGHRVHEHGAMGRNGFDIEKAQSQLGEYGYSLTDDLRIQKGDKTFAVVVSAKGPRFYVKQLSGAPLWSGADLGDFVKSFWYAKKVEHGAMGRNGRGIYHGTPAGKHDIVIYQGRNSGDGTQPNWRIDLVTSTSGTHSDITGQNRGYSAPSAAFTAALDAQHTRGIHGKSHVYIADRDGNLSDYEPEGAHLPFERNGNKFESGSGPYTVYFETGGVSYHIRRPTLTAAKTEALQQAQGRGIIVTVQHKGIEKFEARPDRQVERNGRFEMVRTSRDPGRAGMHQYGPATVWVSGPVSGTWWATVKFRSQEKDLDARSYEGVLQEAADWVDAAPELGGHTPNARTSTVDETAARELSLYIENEYALIGAPNSIGKSIDANLRKKVASGRYDAALAPKAWQYLIDEGAKRYTKEFGSESPIFSAATRRRVAEEFARAWEAENLTASEARSLGLLVPGAR